MGPQHCCCGNRGRVSEDGRNPVASMGPQHCCCGNRASGAAVRRPHTASMGPQHCCCGNSDRRKGTWAPTGSFNGAAALLLRKSRHQRTSEAVERASMGPQHCCCGNSAAVSTYSSRFRLQWGRSIAAAEIGERLTFIYDLKKLQWGRSIAAAEISVFRMPRLTPSSLQWGRSIAAAEIEWTQEDWDCESLLQWGRSIAAAEIGEMDKFSGSVITGFNGAAALLLRKFPRRRYLRTTRYRLQWGRSIAAAEIKYNSSTCVEASCFNGAAALLLRKFKLLI